MNQTKKQVRKRPSRYHPLLSSFIFLVVMIGGGLFYYFWTNSSEHPPNSQEVSRQSSQPTSTIEDSFFSQYNHSQFFPIDRLESFLDDQVPTSTGRIPSLEGAIDYYYRADVGEGDVNTLQILCRYASQSTLYEAMIAYEQVLVETMNKAQVISLDPYESLFSDEAESFALFLSDCRLLPSESMIKIDIQVNV